MVKKKVVWDSEALSQLQECYEYIKERSITSAQKVRKVILEEVKELPNHPESHKLDRFKIENDGNYRAFEKYSYRVSYRIKAEEIRILRVRHTSRSPLKH
ncbi:type II toxin-antitoxin system RelE/ParE family toxin [Aquimarina sp. U1-2]|uniref:type II toxin-antitoxin system RelE/ParE family toxin n=1 Tax=Aquimarina sp. U1-2 TaxID=2823141 RepID=UPI001AECDD05|nr:type II toxin-antitoxin system RelE/ParE family toxin [Aquimarina sp. U1-2]MBP2833291.1 type II toxin-antitoxin system RelE/ParE family toxin [Aquimarina sp. U1-2]